MLTIIILIWIKGNLQIQMHLKFLIVWNRMW